MTSDRWRLPDTPADEPAGEESVDIGPEDAVESDHEPAAAEVAETVETQERVEPAD